MAFTGVAVKYLARANRFTAPPAGDLSAFGVAYAASNAAAGFAAVTASAVRSSIETVFAFAVDALTDSSQTTTDGINFFSVPTSIAFWSAVSMDATREEGRTASDIAGSQLWPLHHGPEPLMSLWNEMEAALLAEKRD